MKLSKKAYLVISTILALLGTLVSALYSYTDGGASTNPDVAAIVDGAGDVYNAVTYTETTGAASE